MLTRINVTLLCLLCGASTAFGADAVHLRVAWWSALPFVGLLLCIALLPLRAPHWWDSNRHRAMISALFAVPVICYMLYLDRVENQRGLHALWDGVEEYLAFIALLWSLYTITGGLAVEINVRGGPVVNSLILLCGAVLANLIGTTGAAMLLIRPFLRINKERTHRYHLPLFFIFVVCNTGGLLTPLGDPPLFLGYLRGVGFFWTLRLWPQWLLVNSILISLFFCWDALAAWRDARPAEVERTSGPLLKVQGRVNLVLLAALIGVVLLESPAVGRLIAREIYLKDATLEKPWGQLAKVCLGLLSLVLTRRNVRKHNGFTWAAIIEVGVIFAGIFVAMVPALKLLEAQDRITLGMVEPWQFFWMTGALSSFLDNAPTYLTFATIAAGEQPISELARIAPELLAAISCGAVFMGANTYIGNGPNFMVKAIAEENQYPMPSFFGYLLFACLILLPIFGLVTWVFFLPQ